MPNLLDSDTNQPLWRDTPIDGALTFEDPGADAAAAVIVEVVRPWLFGYAPKRPNGRAMLVLGGGGYTALMAGREGVAVARWLTSLGYHAYVLIHRFPNAANGVAAPLDDAIEAMRVIRATRLFTGVGAVGLSSGGHLASCLIADYPSEWAGPSAPGEWRPDVLIVGYGPIFYQRYGPDAYRRQGAIAAAREAGDVRPVATRRADDGRPAPYIHCVFRD